MKYKLNDW